MLRRALTLSRRVTSTSRPALCAALPALPALHRLSTTVASNPVAIPKTWGKPAEGPSFTTDYKTEFRPSAIDGAGNGWWAMVDIPKGVRLRRVSVAEGSLLRFETLEEIEDAGWDIDDAVNYGIGHWKDPSSIYFLNPGTAMNHADQTREPSVRYGHDEPNVLELWTVRDVAAGEEMFNAYHVDFAPCPWYDELQRSRGNVPLSQLNAEIEKLYGAST